MEVSAGMRAVVVGLGTSGLAAVRYLHRMGVEVRVSENRTAAQLSVAEQMVLEQKVAAVETGGHTAHFIADADFIVAGPGVPPSLPVLSAARRQGIPVLGELALAAGQIKVPVIAVTGSNGKTTVTSLIGHLLQKAGNKVFVGGNIGTPLFEYLMNPGDSDVVVLEVSSFQLHRTGEFRPDIGLLLNLSADHLDWHGSMEAYAGDKIKLFAHQRTGDVAIIGTDDPLLSPDVLDTAARVYAFGSRDDCRAQLDDDHTIKLRTASEPDELREKYILQETSLDSLVNRYNAAAALLAVRTFGCSREDARQGLVDYRPPEHRMTPVGDIRGIHFVNDSKATNVGAVLAALAGFERNVVLIAGGRAKGSDFSDLYAAVAEHVVHVVLIGEAGEDIGRIVREAVPVEYAGNMSEAVALSYAAAVHGQTVLLAPACASFDMFDNYGQRGRVFTRCVMDLRKTIEGN